MLDPTSRDNLKFKDLLKVACHHNLKPQHLLSTVREQHPPQQCLVVVSLYADVCVFVAGPD